MPALDRLSTVFYGLVPLGILRQQKGRGICVEFTGLHNKVGARGKPILLFPMENRAFILMPPCQLGLRAYFGLCIVVSDSMLS